jgi:hypothetical protein
MKSSGLPVFQGNNLSSVSRHFLPKCNRHIRVYLDGNVVSFNGLRKIHLYPRNFVIQIFYTSRDVFENSSLSERNHAMHIYVSLSPRT